MRSKSIGALLIATISQSGIADTASRFVSRSDAKTVVAERERMDNPWALQLGFDSNVPLSSPVTDFRYQSSNAVVIESSTTLNQDFDLGLSLAIQGLRTRNVTSSGTSSETTTRIETVRIQSLPRVEVYARYVSALAKSAHSFEAELGLGLGFNKTTVSSTDLSTTPQSDRTTAFTARASLGFGLLWNESIVVPIQFGFAFQSLGSKSFSNAVYAVERKGSMSGLYLKSGLRYRF